MKKISELKKKVSVLNREEMKNLVGGICASMVSAVMIHLREGDANDNAQADVIQGMLESGSLVPEDC